MAPAPVSASQSVLVPTYARAPVAFERGEGPWAITADGTRYLDGCRLAHYLHFQEVRIMNCDIKC